MDGQQPGQEAELSAVLQQFPPVTQAFAYGSGVYRQPGLYRLGGDDKPMLDFIFAVDTPTQWHEQVHAARVGVPGVKLAWQAAQHDKMHLRQPASRRSGPAQ